MSDSQLAPNWYEDPSGRYTHRYWDGKTWTGHVANNGEQYYDELEDPLAELGDDDVNIVAIERSGVERDVADWLVLVVEQIERRLNLVQPEWYKSSQPAAVKACAFGLLLGYLATEYPRAKEQLAYVAEVHPSFSTLREGYRLDTLIELAKEPARSIEWLAPLMPIESVERMNALYISAAA